MGLEHGSMQSEGLRFNSSWRLRIFLCPMLVTRRKNIFVQVILCRLVSSVDNCMYTFLLPVDFLSEILVENAKRRLTIPQIKKERWFSR